jgi:hypothetical protein
MCVREPEIFSVMPDRRLAQHLNIGGLPHGTHFESYLSSGFQPAVDTGIDTLEELRDHGPASQNRASESEYTIPTVLGSHDDPKSFHLNKNPIQSTCPSVSGPSVTATDVGRSYSYSSPMPSQPQRTPSIRIPTLPEPSLVMAWTLRYNGNRKFVECGFPGCDRTFSRLPDLKRHYNGTHASEPILFWCPEAGCDRSVGNKPFHRKDKMKAHAWTKHGLSCSN